MLRRGPPRRRAPGEDATLATTTDIDTLRDRLAAEARAHLGPDAEIAGLRRMAGGSSRELWAFDVVGANGRRELVLRRDPAGLADPEGRRREHEALTAAHRWGVPVPQPLWLMADLGPGGESGLVAERLPGVAAPASVLGDEALAGARAGLTADVARAAAAIHAVPLDEVPGLPAPPGPRAPAAIEELERELERGGEPHPALEVALRWLRGRLPPPGPPVLVHGDLRTGNLLVDERGLVGVVDWERVHAGDPAEDLGWLCIRSWRYGRDHLPAGGFGTREELLAAYEAGGGRRIDPEELRFWEVYGNVRWATICVAHGGRAHAPGAGSALARLAMGRRAAEPEWDALELID